MPGGRGCAITLLHTLGDGQDRASSLSGPAHNETGHLHSARNRGCPAPAQPHFPPLTSVILANVSKAWRACTQLQCQHPLRTLLHYPPHHPNKTLPTYTCSKPGRTPRAASCWRRQRRRRPAAAAPAAAPLVAAPASGARLRRKAHAGVKHSRIRGMSNFQGILDWRQASRIQVLLMQGPSTGPG